jgi:hypothetical protein
MPVPIIRRDANDLCATAKSSLNRLGLLTWFCDLDFGHYF